MVTSTDVVEEFTEGRVVVGKVTVETIIGILAAVEMKTCTKVQSSKLLNTNMERHLWEQLQRWFADSQKVE